jgi:hypothetical protein
MTTPSHPANATTIGDTSSQDVAVPPAPPQQIAASAPPVPPGGSGFPEYQIAVGYITLLTDIRFRCLVFVTAIAGIAATWVAPGSDAGTKLVLGLFGLAATTGIAVYELRNSQLYEAAMHRAKHLEEQLGMRGSVEPYGKAGLFGERPPAYVGKNGAALPFFLCTVQHDRGLALIYGAALGAWTYLMIYGLLGLPVPMGLWTPCSADRLRVAALLAGMIVAIRAFRRFKHHDATRQKRPASQAI